MPYPYRAILRRGTINKSQLQQELSQSMEINNSQETLSGVLPQVRKMFTTFGKTKKPSLPKNNRETKRKQPSKKTVKSRRFP